MINQDYKRRVETEPDFVATKHFDFSLKKLIERYPDGAPDRIIAQALCLTEPEVEELYQKAVSEIRELMGVTL